MLHGITIDDAHSRDLDDAVWAEQQGDKTLLTVCIADVAGAIPRGHEHDVDARTRVATRYWSHGNTPMLPRALSEGSLSLLPNQDRQVIVIQMLLNESLDTVGLPKLMVGALKSKMKLAYDLIPGILADPSHQHHSVLTLLRTTALGLLEKRRAAGALAFYDLNEGWTTTEEGHLLRLERAQANVGYIIIQEMMILANLNMARYAGHFSIPVLFRNHTAKIVAPAREELLQQLIATRLDPTQVDALRQRVHAVMNRATYDPVILGHYGLSLPFYLHGSSPIRRYADLVTQRQLRAHIVGEPLPYTQEEVGQEGAHIMEWIRESEERQSEQLKKMAEDRADQRSEMMGADRLTRLKPKDFERVLKVSLKGDYNSEVAAAVQFKMTDGNLSVLDTFLVLFGSTASWAPLRRDVGTYLVRNPHLAPSLAGIGASLLGWSELHFDHKSLQAQGSLFRVVTSITCPPGPGPTHVGPAVVNTSLKVGKAQATVSLLAQMAGIPIPVWKAPRVQEAAAKAVALAQSGNPVNALQEHAQKKTGSTFPEYLITRAGGADHMPLFTCTCTYLGVSRTSPPDGNKKSAKKEAAALVLAALVGAL